MKGAQGKHDTSVSSVNLHPVQAALENFKARNKRRITHISLHHRTYSSIVLWTVLLIFLLSLLSKCCCSQELMTKNVTFSKFFALNIYEISYIWKAMNDMNMLRNKLYAFYYQYCSTFVWLFNKIYFEVKWKHEISNNFFMQNWYKFIFTIIYEWKGYGKFKYVY